MKKSLYVYLVYFVLVSFIVTGISFSRYSSAIASSQFAAAANPVIKYQPVSMTLNGVPMAVSEGGLSIGELMPGDILAYHFNICNFNGTAINQVLMKYRISVIFSPDPSNIPVSCDISPDGVYPPAGDNWVYMGFGTEATHSYTLTVIWDAADDDPEFMNQQQDIEIQIDAEQVDSYT